VAVVTVVLVRDGITTITIVGIITIITRRRMRVV